MTQRNARMMDLRAGELQRSHDPSLAWKTSALYLGLPALRGFWPMGAQSITGSTIYAVNQGGQDSDHDLTLINTLGTAVFGYESLVPWAKVYGTNGTATYLTIGTDAETYDIIGNETYIDDPGLTVGAWWKFDSAIKVEGLMDKEAGVPNISWSMAKTNTGTIQFSVSGDGTAVVNALSSNAIDITSWHLIIGRYDPGAELVVFMDGVKGTPVVAAIPATLYDSSAYLEIGNSVSGFTQTDYKLVSRAFICASRLSDAMCQAIWHHTRATYGR